MRPLTIAAAGLLAVAPAALAAPSGHPTMTAPRSAAVGGLIHVTAGRLISGRYSLNLSADRDLVPQSSCVTRLAIARHPVRAVSFTARIPHRLRCLSGFPSTFIRTVPLRPGSYTLTIGVLQSEISPQAGFSLENRHITIRR
jgi:hypothetical protein